MPNSISYEDETGTMREWTIPPLSKWIKGEALPVFPKPENWHSTEIIVDEEPLSVKFMQPGTPMATPEDFMPEMGKEFRILLMEIITKFFNKDFKVQLVDTVNMDFTDYHGSWSASWMNESLQMPKMPAYLKRVPPSLLNTSGLYIIIPPDAEQVKTEGVRVMYRQAQCFDMEYYTEVKAKMGETLPRNEILTIIFPPLSYDPTKKLDGGTGFGSGGKDKHDDVEYDSEPISPTWLKEQLDGYIVLMVLGVKSKTSACLNWNHAQLNQVLSKITLSSRAS